MIQLKNLKISILILFMLSLFSIQSFAQANEQEITKTIITRDSLFWNAYNTCDIESLPQFITDDVEFYHDKGGITFGQKNLVNSIANNICGNKNYKVRREAVANTIKVYLLKKGNDVYGAIINGDHYFYENIPGKTEKRVGLAKFTDLWILQNNTWQMSRILSYSHGPATN